MAEQIEMTDEQTADFAALSAAASEENQPANSAAAEQADNATERMAAEFKTMFELAVTVLAPALPSLKTIYTPEVTGAASQAIAAVCIKHGWMTGGLFDQWGEEIGAAIILLPLAYSTVQGVRGDLEKSKKPAPEIGKGATLEAQPVQQPQGAGSKTVQFGAVAA